MADPNSPVEDVVSPVREPENELTFEQKQKLDEIGGASSAYLADGKIDVREFNERMLQAAEDYVSNIIAMREGPAAGLQAQEDVALHLGNSQNISAADVVNEAEHNKKDAEREKAEADKRVDESILGELSPPSLPGDDSYSKGWGIE